MYLGYVATSHVVPSFGDPQEGRGYVAISDFGPSFGDPREGKGYVAIPPNTGGAINNVLFEPKYEDKVYKLLLLID